MPVDVEDAMQQPLASEEETKRFLGALWFKWGESVIKTISDYYKLSTEQRDAICEILWRPNDWVLEVEHPLCDPRDPRDD
jgi:hypothetical protein